jgi:hemerythrin
VISIDWGDEYLLGLPDIDAQHLQLADAVKELVHAVYSRADRITWERVTANVIDGTSQHFEYEERMMLEARYPDSGNHQAQHAELLDELRRFCAAQDPSAPIPDSGAGRAVAFLQRWLVLHITLSDRQLVDWLHGPPAGLSSGKPGDSGFNR